MYLRIHDQNSSTKSRALKVSSFAFFEGECNIYSSKQFQLLNDIMK